MGNFIRHKRDNIIGSQITFPSGIKIEHIFLDGHDGKSAKRLTLKAAEAARFLQVIDTGAYKTIVFNHNRIQVTLSL